MPSAQVPSASPFWISGRIQDAGSVGPAGQDLPAPGERTGLCAGDTPCKGQQACRGRRAGSHPAWLTQSPDLCFWGLPVGAFTQGWYGASLEELLSPCPRLGLSLLEAPRGVKAHQTIPWFLFGECWDLHLHPGRRVQLPSKGCSTRCRSKHGAPPPAGGTDSPGAQPGVAEEPEGTPGCSSMSATVLPAGSTHLQHCGPPTSSPRFRW